MVCLRPPALLVPAQEQPLHWPSIEELLRPHFGVEALLAECWGPCNGARCFAPDSEALTRCWGVPGNSLRLLHHLQHMQAGLRPHGPIGKSDMYTCCLQFPAGDAIIERESSPGCDQYRKGKASAAVGGDLLSGVCPSQCRSTDTQVHTQGGTSTASQCSSCPTCQLIWHHPC